MELILVGQPSCGKSTIFNEVVGYKAISSNFPGASIKLTKGVIEIFNTKIEVSDLPGTYSSQTDDEYENATINYILNSPGDTVIVNVIDACVLSRSLELTLQLSALGKPMIIALNMIDEAHKKGIKIDVQKLSEKFGIPVIETNAKRGEGIYQLFETAFQSGEKKQIPTVTQFDKRTELLLNNVGNIVAESKFESPFPLRFLSIKLIEKDSFIKNHLSEFLSEGTNNKLAALFEEFEKSTGSNPEFVISSARHDSAFKIFKETAILSPAKFDYRQRIDDFLMHPIFGYFFLAAILYLMFSLIFAIGSLIEPIFVDNLDRIRIILSIEFGSESFLYAFTNGLISGFGGGIGIVIPFLLPFFFFLAILEDSGYLTRIAYLIDNIMHRIGLHGLSIVPMILGYGCTVPGILATRIIKSTRDKLITATLTTLIPCSARMTIIFGLVGFFISMEAAILIYVLNIIVIAITGKVMSALMPEVSPGLIMEIPRYHIPSIKTLVSKTWLRLKEFVVIAWPILIIGSIVLEIINHFELTTVINNALKFFTTGVLGLPAILGVTLLFGIMRKELALILLFSALGTKNVYSVMTLSQVFSFTIFVTFYIPCLATIAAISKELSWRHAAFITILTFLIAVGLVVLINQLNPF
ncbi:MAG: ferrous iron transport protein B [bacterium]